MSSYELNDKNQAVITIEISGQDYENAVNTVYKRTANRYPVPGFRKGKAPRKIVETYYGESTFFEDAFNELLPASYQQAIEEHSLEPVSRPSIDIVDIKDDKTIVYTATVDLKPEVKLGKYTGIKIKKNEYNVTDEDIEKELTAAQERVARMVDVTDRPVKNGDIITLNFSGSINGEKFEGGTAENQTLEIGSGTFIPGFEEQLVGMSINEEKDITVKFPDDYHAENLKGKDAVFAVKVLAIKEKQLPAIDDEFAKDVSEFDTLEEYKADIKAKLTERNNQRADNEFQQNLIEAVCNNATVDIPASMVEQQLDYQIRDMETRLSYQGLKLEDYLAYTGMTLEGMRQMYREDAEKTVKRQLVIEAIKKAENITADQESIDAEIERYAKMYSKTAEEFKAQLHPEDVEYISDSIAIKKTYDFLLENNKPAAKRTSKKAADKADKNDAQEEDKPSKE